MKIPASILLQAASGIALSAATPAWAQNQPISAAQAPDGSEDIVVTARRKEERLIDVPVAVTAKSGDALRAEGVQTLLDLGRVAPSLTVSQSPRGSNTPSFTMRGQRVIDTSLVLDPVVVNYFNEVPFMRPQGLNAALFDIQSVQVLRGPQGTLFGRNTTGGAVLVTTVQPSNAMEGNFETTMGNLGLLDAKGAFNIPLAEGAALRIAGTIRTRDGFMYDRQTGFDANSQNYKAVRATLKLEPAAGVTSTFYANYFQSKDHGTANVIYAVNPAIASLAPVLPTLNAQVAANKADPWSFNNNDAPLETAKTYDFSNISTINLSDSLTLKNVAGYRKINTFSKWDIDGSSLFLLRFKGESHIRQFSDELQLQGNSRAFDWIVGLFYFNEKGSDIATSNLPSAPTVDRPSGVYAKNISYSAFASGTYRFGETGLSLNLGLRYTHDKKASDGLQMTGSNCTFRLLDGTVIAPPCLFHQEVSFNEPSWLASLNYKFNDELMIYAAHRHGYRAGGLQSRATTEAAAIPYDPEKVNDVELGLKLDTDLGGGAKLRFNVAAYEAWYKDIQRQVSFVSPTSGTLVSSIFNAARSRIRGVEVEATLQPVTGLSLSGSFSYTDPKYKSFINNGVDVAAITPFGYIPKYTANAQVSYTLPADDKGGEIVGTAGYRYQSRYYSADVVVPVGGYINGWDLVNLRLDYNNIGGSGIGLSAYVNNLFNKAYFAYATNLTASSGYATGLRGDPRMYGVSARFEF